jgi:hypothetical protein
MNANQKDSSLLSEYFDEPSRQSHPSMTVLEESAVRLRVTLLNGTSFSLPYVALSQLRFVPGEALTMEFAGGPTIVCRGVNLDVLFEALNRHEVESIEQVAPVEMETQHGVVILSLDVE